MEKLKMHLEKRIFDIVVSLLALVLFSPFILSIIIGMALEGIFSPPSRGKIFYSETRISAGEPFKIYKFRIFKKEGLNRVLKAGQFVHTKELEKDINNLTHAGRFLKKIYMDELPQLVNVLKGEMTLVGPRPTNIINYERLITERKYAKYLMRAGLIGYYQSHKGIKIHKNQEELDMEYINFCQDNPGWKVILYDIKIIFITILTVLRAEGA